MNIIFLYITLLSGIFNSENPTLTIHIENITKIQGKIVIGIFNSEKDFLKDDAAFKNYFIQVDASSESIVIKDLPKGEYAITFYHDENSDDECNRNFLGIPKEGYGFSNNIKPKFSAPSFKDCKFSLMKDVTQKIKVIK